MKTQSLEQQLIQKKNDDSRDVDDIMNPKIQQRSVIRQQRSIYHFQNNDASAQNSKARLYQATEFYSTDQSVLYSS